MSNIETKAIKLQHDCEEQLMLKKKVLLVEVDARNQPISIPHSWPLFLNANGATLKNDPTFFLLKFPMISNAISTGVKIKIWDKSKYPLHLQQPKIIFKSLNSATPEENKTFPTSTY